jgi:pimeloyl-ACP methyl ester carboxylesterase
MTKTARLPIGDLTLNIRRSGRGRPVLLLHGFPDSLVMWRKVAPLFTAQGRSVISYDQRGFGHSDAPSGKRHYTISRIVEDAVRVLSALEISGPVDVIGHDWGAVIGWCLCLSHPDLVRRHVAISVGHPRAYATAGLRQKRMGLYTIAFQFPGVAEARLARNDYAGLRAWLRRSGHPDEEGVVGELSRAGRLTAGLNYYRANLLPVMIRGWPDCRVPTMGIWGDQDPYLAEDQMVHSERHMEAPWRYERIAGSGHWLPLECPRRVAGLALDWFAGGD